MESGAVWLGPVAQRRSSPRARQAWTRGPAVARRAADQRGAPRRASRPTSCRVGEVDDAPAGRGRRLRRLLRQRAPRDQRRPHLPTRLRAADPQLEAPADRLPRPLRAPSSSRAPTSCARSGQRKPPTEPAPVFGPSRAARHRGRARLRRRRRHPPRRAGAARGCRRAPLRRRPAQRLVGARPAGLGVRAARAVPRQVVRHLDLAVGRHDRRAAGRPGAAARPGPASRCPTCAASRPTTARARPTGSTCTSRSTGTARSSPGRSSATCTGRRRRWWRT